MSSIASDLLRACVWLAVLAALFIPLERLWTLRPQKLRRRALGLDLAYYFLGNLLPGLLLALPLTLLAALLHRLVPADYYLWAASVPTALRLPLAVLVGEVGTYWGHRWCHEIPALWRFHAIHHSAEEMDWLVNARAHPIDVVFERLCGLVPLYGLGLAQPAGGGMDLVPMLFTLIGTTWGYFIHANLKWRFAWLEYVVSSPAFHHWHHTNDRRELHDKNYAALLPMVDKLFGTLYLPAQWPAQYGVDQPVPETFAGQLLSPLWPEQPAPPAPRAVYRQTSI